MLIKDLRQKKDDELKLLVVQLRIQLMENRFQAAQGQLTKTHLIKEIRKLIARVLTVLHERNLRMDTKDYHRFNQMIIAENQKAQAAVGEEKNQVSFTERIKSKLGGLKIKQSESSEQK
ncbi:LSU ribosomal protein L29p [[Mycoplasma] cavipharyngis]|uniref:50S ribosomal protein L29 n=1 Tax=[Mycoplasma] cavipharyngis TaxID=92757 RepID=UPI0037038CDE